MRTPGLSRQIALSMSAVVLSVTLLILVGSYVFYGLMIEFNQSFATPPDSWIPTQPEWIWMGSVVLAGLVIAVVSAARLARRILTPLNSVADSVRRIAQGDLNARATKGDHTLGEASLLVDDFNAMAERLQRVAGEMTTWNAAIAHELRTPVTILRGRLQGLAEGVFTPDETQFRSLLKQVEGLSTLIEDLRVLSLADSGHLALKPETVNLAPEIRALTELIDPNLHQAGFTLILDLIDEPVSCDVARIRQALLGLLENARRYANPGRIWIETDICAEGYRLRVEDEGPGIADDLGSQIFEAFQRGDDSRSRCSGGSGLGLAVVRAIAQAHGGDVHYRRGRTGGALFELNLPRWIFP